MGSGNSSTQQGTNSGSSAPWMAQAPYLTSAFKNAQDTYNNNIGQGAYSGDYVAPTNTNQWNSAANTYNQAGVDQGANNSLMGTAQGLIQPGVAGQTGALSGMTDFAGTNQTQGNIANAKDYTSGFDVPGQVKAAMQGANQEASDVTLPSLYRGAAASGNINSDRTAVAQGVVDRGLAQQAAGLTSQLNNSNYQNGLNLSENSNAQKLQALSQLGSLGSNTTQQGLNGISTGINNQGAINNQATQGADQQQALAQSNLNNTMAKYNGNQNFGWSQLQNLMNIIKGNYGGTTTGSTTGTTQQNPSLLSNLGSIAGIIGSLTGGGKGFGTQGGTA